MQQVLFSRQNTFYTQFKIPKNIKHELPHNHSKNLKPSSSPLCWSLKKHMKTPLDLFLSFLAQRKFNRQDSSNPVVLIQFYFYLFTTPKIQIQHTLFSFQKVQQLSYSSSPKKHAFTFSTYIKYIPHHLISLLPQNPPTNLLAKT